MVLNKVVTTCLLGYIKYNHNMYVSMLFLVVLFMKVKVTVVFLLEALKKK
jgi:hypothetical protein